MSNSSHRTIDRRIHRVGYSSYPSTSKPLYDQYMEARLERPELRPEEFLEEKNKAIPIVKHHGPYSPLNPNDEDLDSRYNIDV